MDFCYFFIFAGVISKSIGLLQLTDQFPVTQREKRLSLVVFEVISNLLLVFVVISSFCLSVVIKYGVAYIPELTIMLFNNILFCLLLLVIYYGFDYFATKLGLNRLKEAISLSLLMVCFFLMYRYFNSLTDVLVSAYLNKTQTGLIIFLLEEIYHSHGFLVSLVLFLFCFAVLLTLIVSLPIQIRSGKTRFVKIYSVKNPSIGLSYFLSIVRSQETFTSLFITIILFCILLDSAPTVALAALFILVVNGIYIFVNTNPIRYLTYTKNISALKDYSLLFFTQLIFLLGVEIPMSVVSVIFGVKINDILFFWGVTLIGILFTTLVGILFPPYMDNPFSALFNILVLIAFSLMFGLCFAIFNKYFYLSVFIGLCFCVASVVYAVIGLEKTRMKVLHVTN